MILFTAFCRILRGFLVGLGIGYLLLFILHISTLFLIPVAIILLILTSDLYIDNN